MTCTRGRGNFIVYFYKIAERTTSLCRWRRRRRQTKLIYSMRRRRCASAGDVAAQFVGLSKFNLAKVRLGRRMRARQRLPYTYNIKNCHLVLLYTCVQIFVKKKKHLYVYVQTGACAVFFVTFFSNFLNTFYERKIESIQSPRVTLGPVIHLWCKRYELWAKK